jgi:hypothetical protein
VRRIQSERRASGELVHVELTPGAVTILPAWKLDAVYCASLKVGAPQVSLAALCSLRELLITCESRLISADGNIVTQEAQDGSAVTARTKDGACLQAHGPDGTTPARSRSRRRASSAELFARSSVRRWSLIWKAGCASNAPSSRAATTQQCEPDNRQLR